MSEERMMSKKKPAYPVSPELEVYLDEFSRKIEIPIYYDPMIAKLITYGQDRESSIEVMKKAIAQYEIVGIETTLPFGAFVFRHDDFVSGNFNTHFVKKNFSAEAVEKNQEEDRKVAAVFAVKKYLETIEKVNPINHHSSIWTQSRNQ